MSAHFNGLTPAEAERLALLSEELGEAQQAIGKVLRHGYGSCHPDAPRGPDNREALEKELGDVSAAVGLLTEAGDLSEGRIDYARDLKRRRVGRYMHHQGGG